MFDIFDLGKHTGKYIEFSRYQKDSGEYTEMSGTIANVKSHKQRVNLSVLLSSIEEVELDKSAQFLGLPKVYPAIKYQQASVFRDGEIGDFEFKMDDFIVDSRDSEIIIEYNSTRESMLEYIFKNYGSMHMNLFLKECMIYAMNQVSEEYSESLSENTINYLKQFGISADGTYYGERKSHNKVSKKVRIVEVSTPFKIPTQKDFFEGMLDFQNEVRITAGIQVVKYIDYSKANKQGMINAIANISDMISEATVEITKQRAVVHKYEDLFGSKFKEQFKFTDEMSGFEGINFDIDINVTERTFSV